MAEDVRVCGGGDAWRGDRLECPDQRGSSPSGATTPTDDSSSRATRRSLKESPRRQVYNGYQVEERGGPMLDCAIMGGIVVDGTGAAGVQADVGVRDGRIVAVGQLEEGAKRV